MLVRMLLKSCAMPPASAPSDEPRNDENLSSAVERHLSRYFGGFNDSLVDARRLIKLAGGLNAKVNLIPFNAWPGSELKSPEPKNVMAFEQCLMDSPVTVMLRREKGSDILAACGQLAGGINAGTD